MLLNLSSLIWPNPYHRELLEASRKLVREGHPEVAVVTAHMACEIFTDALIEALFRGRQCGDLVGPVGELLPSSNLANERVRALYSTLSGDSPQNTPGWAEFKELSKTRNRVIHGGARVTGQEATTLCDAADRMLSHLESVLTRIRGAGSA